MWTVEQSSDGETWHVVASFGLSWLAHWAFDAELNIAKRFKRIRLLSPDGVVEERAVVEITE